MPLRITPFRAATAAPLPFPGFATVVHHHHHNKHNTPPPLSSFFHSTPSTRRDEIDNKTHYEVLQVQTNAHPTDIKKSFYALSKANHPDHNQHDPAAGKRFVRISEAYSVLSSAERRAKYDRDVLRLHERPAHAHGHHHHHRGSYSSTGPAGGRPASGLSRRRGAFHGPPPSFYRNGGWGAHQAKRSQAHEETSGGGGGAGRGGADDAQSQRQQWWNNNTSHSGDGFRNFGGGMGPGQDPLGKGDAAGGSGIPHFDRAAQAAHTRTQARVDEIRRKRMEREYDFPSASDWGESRSFFAVLTVLGIAIGVPYFVTREWTAATAKKKKKEWDRTATG